MLSCPQKSTYCFPASSNSSFSKVLLLHGPVRSLNKNFFVNNEFDADLLLSADDFGNLDYVLSDWVDKERPDYLRVYVVSDVKLA